MYTHMYSACKEYSSFYQTASGAWTFPWCVGGFGQTDFITPHFFFHRNSGVANFREIFPEGLLAEQEELLKAQ